MHDYLSLAQQAITSVSSEHSLKNWETINLRLFELHSKHSKTTPRLTGMKFTESMTMTDFFSLQQDITFDSGGNLQAQVYDAVYNSTSFEVQDEQEDENSMDSDSEQNTVSDEQTTTAPYETTPPHPLCPFIIKSKELCKGICDRLSRSGSSVSQPGQTSTSILPTSTSYIDWDLAVLEHNLGGISDLDTLVAWLYRNLDIREQVNGLWWPVMQEDKGQEGANLLAERLENGKWWIVGDESGELKDTIVDKLGRGLGNGLW